MHEREGLLYSSREERLGHEFDILVGPRQCQQLLLGKEGILEVGGGRPGNKCAVRFFSMSCWQGGDLQWLSTPTPSEEVIDTKDNFHSHRTFRKSTMERLCFCSFAKYEVLCVHSSHHFTQGAGDKPRIRCYSWQRVGGHLAVGGCEQPLDGNPLFAKINPPIRGLAGDKRRMSMRCLTVFVSVFAPMNQICLILPRGWPTHISTLSTTMPQGSVASSNSLCNQSVISAAGASTYISTRSTLMPQAVVASSKTTCKRDDM